MWICGILRASCKACDIHKGRSIFLFDEALQYLVQGKEAASWGVINDHLFTALLASISAQLNYQGKLDILLRKTKL